MIIKAMNHAAFGFKSKENLIMTFLTVGAVFTHVSGNYALLFAFLICCLLSVFYSEKIFIAVSIISFPFVSSTSGLPVGLLWFVMIAVSIALIIRLRFKLVLWYRYSFVVPIFLVLIAIFQTLILQTYLYVPNLLIMSSWGVFFYGFLLVIKRGSLDYGFILKSVNFMILAVVLSLIFELVTQGFSFRLGLGGSIRGLANAVGFSTVILLLSVLRGEKGGYKHNFWNVAFGLVSFLIVLSTISRGVILSVLLSFSLLICIMILEFFWRRGIVKKAYFPFLAIPVLAAPGFVYFIYVFGEGLINRLSRSGDGVSIRQDIWAAGIAPLENLSLIFGSGVSSFQDNALATGYDFYAHSVFVDSLVSLGVLGFLVVLIFFLHLFIYAFRTYNLIVFSMAVFMTFSFSTHGGLTNPQFWLSAAIVTGSLFLTKHEA